MAPDPGSQNPARVLVTGASSGIGRAIALTLDRAGYAITATGRNGAALEALQAEAPGIETLRLDLEDRAQVEAALAGRQVDVLIANAGVMPRPGPFQTLDFAAMDQTVTVNLLSVLWLTRLVLPQMRARRSGHLIFTGSTAGHAPGANFAVYAATKAAVSAFASGLRAELSPDGIRVCELVPGRVETGLYTPVLDPGARAALYENGNALQPEDIAEAVLSVLRLPMRASVARIEILPTRPVPPISMT